MRVLALLLCSLVCFNADATIHKCEDEQGEVTYQALPCSDGETGAEIEVRPPPPAAAQRTPRRIQLPPQYRSQPPSRIVTQLPAAGSSGELKKQCRQLTLDYQAAKREKAQRDKEIVEACRKRREIYCDLPADEIEPRRLALEKARVWKYGSDVGMRNYFRNLPAAQAAQPDPKETYQSERKRLGCGRLR